MPKIQCFLLLARETEERRMFLRLGWTPGLFALCLLANKLNLGTFYFFFLNVEEDSGKTFEKRTLKKRSRRKAPEQDAFFGQSCVVHLTGSVCSASFLCLIYHYMFCMLRNNCYRIIIHTYSFLFQQHPGGLDTEQSTSVQGGNTLGTDSSYLRKL